MKVTEVSCKSALSKSGLGYDYALNPYRGCEHGCTYCYAPAVLRESRSWGQFVDIKRNIPSILARELRRQRKGHVGIGTVTDAYQPVEQRYEVTRRCLEQLLRVDFPISVQTKSPLVLRDLDLLQQFSRVDVGVTITTLDETFRKVFEPRAASVPERLVTLEQLSAHGIPTWLFLGPILPAITDRDLEGLIKAAAKANVQEIIIDKLRLKAGIWKRMVSGLQQTNPELIKVLKRTLWGNSPYFTNVGNKVKHLCNIYRICYQVAFERLPV
ncbi:MAG: radical SAM protein [Candidatus Heimdallarchaeota archaeon]